MFDGLDLYERKGWKQDVYVYFLFGKILSADGPQRCYLGGVKLRSPIKRNID